MKNSTVVVLVACVAMLSTTCAGMGNVKRVGPILPGQSTLTTTALIGQISDETTATPIFNSDAVSYAVTITLAGNYQLVENITNPISIQASRVFLNLNSYMVTNTNPLQNVVTLSSALSEVAVYGGYIQNTGGVGTGAGIYIGSGCSKITVRDLTVFGCHHGVRCAGIVGTNNDIISAGLTGLKLISNDVGLLLEYTKSSIVRNCNALYSAQTGFELNNCQATCLYDCNALKSTGTGTVVGFKSTGGTSNMFQRCVSKQTITSSTTFGDKACGFLLTGTELKTKILDCVVNETDVVSSPTAVTYGINCEPIIQPTADLFSEKVKTSSGANYLRGLAWSPNGDYVAEAWYTTTQLSVCKFNGTSYLFTCSATPAIANACAAVDWSPDGRYLAAGFSVSAAGCARVYSFTEQALSLVASSTDTGLVCYSVAWSPNGKYLLATDAASPGSVRIYAFDGTTLGGPLSVVSFTHTSGNNIQAAWSPDGKAIAVVQGVTGTKVHVIPVSPAGIMGTSVDSAVVASGTTGFNGVAWCPNGTYFASGDTANNLRIWKWDGSAVTNVTSVVNPTANPLEKVAWSPNGKYIVTSCDDGDLRMYNFNGEVAPSLITTYTVVASSVVSSLAWSPCGKYLVAGTIASPAIHAFVSAMYGPSNCLINNCRVCDTQANNLNLGRGIVSACVTSCLQNACCNNGVNYSYGIPNTYDGRFEILRGVVQPYDNVSMPETL